MGLLARLAQADCKQCHVYLLNFSHSVLLLKFEHTKRVSNTMDLMNPSMLICQPNFIRADQIPKQVSVLR